MAAHRSVVLAAVMVMMVLGASTMSCFADDAAADALPFQLDDYNVEDLIDGSRTVLAVFLPQPMPRLEAVLLQLHELYKEKDDVVIAAAGPDRMLIERFALSKLPAVRLFTKGLPLAAPTRVAYTADMQLDDFADVIEETRRLCAGLPSELAVSKEFARDYLWGEHRGNYTFLKKALAAVDQASAELAAKQAKLEYYRQVLRRVRGGGPNWLANQLNDVLSQLYHSPEYRTTASRNQLLMRFNVMRDLQPADEELFQGPEEIVVDENGNRVAPDYWEKIEAAEKAAAEAALAAEQAAEAEAEAEAEADNHE